LWWAAAVERRAFRRNLEFQSAALSHATGDRAVMSAGFRCRLRQARGEIQPEGALPA